MAINRRGQQPHIIPHPPIQYPCPHCRQIGVAEYPIMKHNGTKNGLGLAGAIMFLIGLAGTVLLCGIGAFLLPPAIILIIVALCLPSETEDGIERFCHACGHRWKVV